MIATITSFCLFLLPLSLGYLLVIFITRKNRLPFFFSVSLGFGLGMGLLTQWILVLGILKIPFSDSLINYPLCLVVATLLFLCKKHDVPIFKKRFKDLFQWEKTTPFTFIFILYILFYVVYVFWRCFNVPIASWDAFSTNVFKAKIFFYARSLEYLPNVPKYSYPIHVPLLQTWISLCLNVWNDQLVKIAFPFYFISTLSVCYYFLKNYTSKFYAFLGLVLLVSSHLYIFHSTVAYRDATLLYYHCTTLICIFLWFRKRDRALLLLASLFAGLLTFVKLEGSGYLVIHTALLLMILLKQKNIAIKKKFMDFLLFTIPSYSICFLYHFYKYFAITLPQMKFNPARKDFDIYNLQFQLSFDSLRKLSNVLELIFKNILLTSNWNIIWLIFLVSLLLHWNKKVLFEIKVILVLFVLFFSIYIPSYTFTQHYYWVGQTHTVLSRNILHLFPFAVFLIILINFPSKIRPED